MITGLKFPAELETNKDLVVYRKYLEQKAMEQPSSNYSLILPTLAGAGVGAIVATGAKQKVWPLMAAGASIPAIMGYIAKKYDDAQIGRAQRLYGAPDEALLEYMPTHIQKDTTLSPYFKNFDITPALTSEVNPIFTKLAAGVISKAKKAIAATILGGAAITAGGVAVSKEMNPEKWKKSVDPVTKIMNKPKLIIRE